MNSFYLVDIRKSNALQCKMFDWPCEFCSSGLALEWPLMTTRCLIDHASSAFHAWSIHMIQLAARSDVFGCKEPCFWLHGDPWWPPDVWLTMRVLFLRPSSEVTLDDHPMFDWPCEFCVSCLINSYDSADCTERCFWLQRAMFFRDPWWPPDVWLTMRVLFLRPSSGVALR